VVAGPSVARGRLRRRVVAVVVVVLEKNGAAKRTLWFEVLK
jgi:hypothetical protein